MLPDDDKVPLTSTEVDDLAVTMVENLGDELLSTK
jgi:hypothetical protein